MLVYRNLAYLLENIGPDKIYVYVPTIEGYNTEQDVEKSIKILKFMGVKHIVRGSANDPKLISLALMNNTFDYKNLRKD